MPAVAHPVVDYAVPSSGAVVDVDVSAFDGARRKRRAALTFIVLAVVVFGGLFAMLAQSYTHAHP